MPRLAPALALAGGLAASLAVTGPRAAAADAIMPPPADQIVLHMQAEGWVETKTARVVVVVERALKGEEAAKEQGRAPAVLGDLAKGAEWQVTGFDRSRDPTGLEHWRITAEARLPETALGGIYDRAQSLSQPGRQVQVSEVDFSPTLAEREETARKLRAEIYRRAEAEAKQVAGTWPDQGYRVHRIDFMAGARPMSRYAEAGGVRTMAAPAKASAPAEAATTLSERMVVSATVILSAPGKQPAGQ